MRGDNSDLTQVEIAACLGWYEDIARIYPTQRAACNAIGISDNTLRKLRAGEGVYRTYVKIFNFWRELKKNIFAEKSRILINKFMSLWAEK
jgi:hypothetical protein